MVGVLAAGSVNILLSFLKHHIVDTGGRGGRLAETLVFARQHRLRILMGVLLDEHQVGRIAQIERGVRVGHFVGQVGLGSGLGGDLVVRLRVILNLVLPQTFLRSFGSI